MDYSKTKATQFIFSIKKVLLLILTFVLFNGILSAEDNYTTINIVNAKTTTYTKNKETGDDLIILEGDVEISVTKGSTATSIKADKITYDRQTEMLFAEENVEISTKGSSGGEKTTASSVLMNTSTLEGIFDDGRVVQTQSDAINLPSGSTLVVFSDMFGKSENNTIAFKNSSLTFCDAESPHWKINSTRTWLLPGGEFAFFNALLYVGPVPVLYLPAFYYPKDELIYNPVFGKNPRTGYYIQTTSYIIGRKPLSSSTKTSSSDDTASAESVKALYNFMKPSSLKTQRREGLILHNLNEDYKGDTTKYLKVMVDWYSNLGAMTGVEGVFKPNEYLSSINFNTNLGFSTTIFKASNGAYLPYSTQNIKYWDKSNFMGLKLPFRYGANFDMTIAKPVKITLSLPVYSDPYFSNDFKTREESMDWISYFMTNTDDDDVTTSEISSYTWKLSMAYSPVLPAFLKPYVSSVSSSITSSVLISTLDNKNLSEDSRAEANDGWKTYTPERRFYYPSQVNPGNVSLSVSGTIFQWPMSSSSAKNSAKAKYSVPLEKPEELMTAKELEEKQKKIEEALKKKEEEAQKEALESEGKDLKQAAAEKQIEEKTDEKTEAAEKSDSADGEKKEELEFLKPDFPELAASVTSVSKPSGLTYKLSYSASPSLNTQFTYASTDAEGKTYLNEPADFDWQKIKAFMYTFKSPVELNSNLNYGGNFFSITNKIAYDSSLQGHPNTDGYSDTQKKSLIYTDYNATSQAVTNTNSVSFKPFAYLPHFADTGVSWNTTMKLFRRKFTGDSSDQEWLTDWDDSWENLYLDWEDADSVTAHTMNVVLSANEMSSKFKQTFTFTSTLSPQVPKYYGSLDLIFPYVTAGINTSISQKSKDDQTWVKNPISQTLSVSLLNSKLKLNESLSYNLEKEEWDSLKASATWNGLSLSYVMSNTYGYDFDEETGWIAHENKNFLPYSFSFAYSLPSKTWYTWYNRVSISPGLSTSITADLIRPTNSSFTFTPSISFKINQFFTITFSSSSRNTVLYRYFQTMLGHPGRIPGEQNVLIDLLDSFRFDDIEKRKASGFKLKSLKLDITHDLHDWSFKMSCKFEPRLVNKNGQKYYDYNPYITIGIVWNPMESMKASIVDDYGEWKFE